MTTFSERYFKYIKASNFLPEFCGIENSTTTYHKIRGLNGNKKPVDFTDAEKAQIRKGLKKLVKELSA